MISASAEVDEFESDPEDLDGVEDQETLEVTIRSFEDLFINRSLQEYCKPFALEALAADYDDVCQVAVYVARLLMQNRVEDF